MMNGFNRPRMPMQNPGAGRVGGNTPNGNAYGYWRNQQGQNPGYGQNIIGYGRPRTPQAPQQPQIGGPLPPYNPQQPGMTTIGNGFSNATVPTPNFNQSSTPLPSAPPPGLSSMPAMQGQSGPPPNVQAFLDYLRQRYMSALSGQQYG